MNQNKYNCVISGDIGDDFALLNINIVSPFVNWSDVKFIAKIDLKTDDKLIDISVERNGVKKGISLSGKYVEGLVDFKLKSPFIGYENLDMHGSLDRKRRSADFSMMNDDAALLARPTI